MSFYWRKSNYRKYAELEFSAHVYYADIYSTSATFLYLLFSGLLSAPHTAQASLTQASLAAMLGSCSVSTSLIVSEALAWDRLEGTTTFVMLAPRSPWALWTGRVLALMGVNMLSNIVTLFATLSLVSMHTLTAISWRDLLVLTLVTLISSTGFGISRAALSMLMKDIYTLSNFLSAVLPIIGGIIAPVSSLPSPPPSSDHSISITSTPYF
ncbi:ABC transporter permease [Alloscardovia omnicolens]